MQDSNIYDLIVVGAGFAGLSAAYHFSNSGKKVLVLEADNGKNSASFASTAEMNHDPDFNWGIFVKKFGLKMAQDVWKLNDSYINILSEFAHSKKTKNFETKRLSAILFSTKNKDIELKNKFNIYKKIANNVEILNEPEKIFPKWKHAFEIYGEGRTNNQAILSNLKKIIKLNEGKIKYYHKVSKIENKNYYTITANNSKKFFSKKVLIATGDQNIEGLQKFKIEKIKTFVIKLSSENIHQKFKSSVFWDTCQPFHYIRTFAGNQLWVGGEDTTNLKINKKVEELKVRKLLDFSNKTLGLDKSYKFLGHWSGVFHQSKRSIPYIFNDKKSGIMYSVGFGGSGLIMSLVSGYLHFSWESNQLLKFKKIFDNDWE